MGREKQFVPIGWPVAERQLHVVPTATILTSATMISATLFYRVLVDGQEIAAQGKVSKLRNGILNLHDPKSMWEMVVYGTMP